MTDHELDAEILLYALNNTEEDAEGDNVVLDIPQFAEERGYDQSHVCRHVKNLYPYLEYGVSPRFPWIGYKQREKIEQRLQDWGYHE